MSSPRRKSFSSHSVKWNNRDLRNECDMNIDEEGILRVPMRGFCSWGTYDSQTDKLCYILEMCVYTNGISVNTSKNSRLMPLSLDTLYNCEDFKTIEEQIISFVGPECKGVRFYNDAEYGYIDDTPYSSVNKFLEKYNTDVLEFVFGDAVLYYEYDGE